MIDNFSKDQSTLDFSSQIKKNEADGVRSKTTLKTDQKVLARITDGIYRHVSSALRELICNSYDADATEVYVETDLPRFKKIVVRDNGNGMSAETLSNMLHHIGGSAKRNFKQAKLGVSKSDDITRSPVKERKLIGKIGIGLFSVAQLTREFSIITKQKGSGYYLIAEIKLHNYSESEVQEIEKRGEDFETGSVEVYSRKAEDVNAHGTDIILYNIKRSAVDQLRSVEIWQQVLSGDEDFVGRDAKPDFHIGAVDSKNDDILIESPRLPWKPQQSSELKFKSLYNALVGLENNNKHPSLTKNLDNYLHMLWSLGLSLPVRYFDKNPWGVSLSDCPYIYEIQNNEKAAKKIESLHGKPDIGSYLGYVTKVTTDDFSVFFDGVEILRPIKPVEDVKTSAAFNSPILFYGSYEPDLSKIDKDSSGGRLKFEAFIKWSPRITPKEHRGVIIRIHGATGVLFDAEFMRWQLAEYYIKGQLTVEINILDGFESALNIDRESYNIAHPHYQIVMRWLHHALKQAVYAIKNEKAGVRQEQKKTKTAERDIDLYAIVSSIRTTKHDSDERPATVIVVKNSDIENSNDNYVFKITEEDFNDSLYSKDVKGERKRSVETKLSAITGILDKFGLLESLRDDEISVLFQSLIKVLSYED